MIPRQLFSFQFRVYEGVQVLHSFLSNPPVKMMVLAAANSELSQASATISELYNLVQVCIVIGFRTSQNPTSPSLTSLPLWQVPQYQNAPYGMGGLLGWGMSSENCNGGDVWGKCPRTIIILS